ncbi:MAG: Ig-like domain-containing protein [Halanaerobiales bacterium]
MKKSKWLAGIWGILLVAFLLGGCLPIGPTEYSLDLKVEGEGSVDVNDRIIAENKVMNFKANSTIELNPVADEEWMFLEWTGVDRKFIIHNDNGPDKLVMDRDKELTAKFVKKLVTIEQDELLLEPGEEEQLEVIIEVEGTEVSYSSGNEDVVEIDGDGKVKAIGVGETDITLTAEKGEKQVELTVEVTVRENFDFDYSELVDGKIYFADKTNDMLKCWDTEAEVMKEVASFDNSISAMVSDDNSIYVAEGVRLWKYDVEKENLVQDYDADESINSLYYLGDYMIVNDSSGSWTTNRLVDLSDFIECDSNDWVKSSQTYVNFSEQETVYILNDGTSPDDIKYQKYDLEDETLGENGESPYHGDYSLSHPLKQFGEEEKIMEASGNIFDVSGEEITHDSNLGYKYIDVLFYEDRIFVLNNDEGARLIVLEKEKPYSKVNTPVEFKNREGKRLFVDGKDIYIITQDEEGNIYVDQYDIETLI